jgi:hypothetical protein
MNYSALKRNADDTTLKKSENYKLALKFIWRIIFWARI